MTTDQLALARLSNTSRQGRHALRGAPTKNSEALFNDIVRMKNLAEAGDIESAYRFAHACWFNWPWNIDLVIAMCEVYYKNGEHSRAFDLIIEARKRIPNWRLQRCYTGLLTECGYVSDYVRDQLDICMALAPHDVFLPLVDMISYMWRVQGCGRRLNDLCLRLEKFKKLRPSDYLLLAAIYNETGQYARAINMHQKARNLDADFTGRMQYLSLGITLSKRGILSHEEAMPYLLSNLKISKDQESFKDLVLKSRSAIAVVGNSPVLLNSGSGDAIDAHDLVIRFNGYSTDFAYNNDYGSKTNVWVKTGHYLDVPRRNINNFDCVVLSGCNFQNRSAAGLDLVWDHVNSSSSIAFIPNAVYEDLFRGLQATPSAGLCIIYWIYTLIGPIPKSSVFGFSHGLEMADFERHYFSNTKKRGVSTHNWENESRFMQQCLR